MKIFVSSAFFSVIGTKFFNSSMLVDPLVAIPSVKNI